MEDGDGSSGNGNPVGGIILTILTFTIVNCTLVASVMIARRTRRARVMQGEGQGSGTQLSKKERKERRYRAIEKWMVNKSVCEHDGICDSLQKGNNGSNESSGENNESAPVDEEWACSSLENDLEDDHTRECPICMDVIAKGEIVSWSATPACSHIFHHQCIKQWLLKHRECPFCRECFLPVDVPVEKELSESEIDGLHAGLSDYSTSCFYCIEHGIVNLPHEGESCFLGESELAEIRNRAAEAPDLEELVQIRGECKVIPEPVKLSEICIAADAEAEDTTSGQSSNLQRVANDEEQGRGPQSCSQSDDAQNNPDQ